MSNPLFNLIEKQLGNNELMETLTRQIGASDVNQTKSAADGVVAALTGALAKNASSEQGVSTLAKVLDRDHDGSILDDVAGLFNGNTQVNPKAANGQGIVTHLLGDKQSALVDMVSKASGLDKNQVGGLMQKIAPLLMGALGKTKKDGNLDVGALTGLLQGAISQKKGNPLMDMAINFLDKDKDGNVVDDLVEGVGKGLLGKIFGKKK
jgi:hypothetical protein